MRLVIISLSLFFLTLAAASPTLDGKIHIPEKCEDVLSVKVCQKLTDAARNLKLTKDQVKEAVINAVKNGKTKAEEIYNSAKDFLQQKVLSKKCEDFTTADTCAKLRALAGKLKVASNKVEEFVIKAVADGAIKANDLYNKVVDYYKTEIATKTCEDFLSKANCERIRQVASALKVKATDLEKTIVSAITKAYIDGKDALQSTFEKLKDLAKNTTCEDLLNPTVCATLRKYAQLTKVAFPKIMDVVKDAIIKGYKLGKGLLKAIYAVTDYFYDCEDVFTKSSCDRLKYWLGKLGVKVAQIDQIVREYAKKGIAKASELYRKIYDFLKEKVICKINPWCKSSLVVKRGIVTDLIKDIKKALEKAIVATQAKIDEQLKKLAAKVKDASDKMVKAVEEMLLKMKMAASDVAKFLKEIFDTKSGNGTTKDVRITKRDIYQKLQEAFKNAHGYVKALIQNLMTMSKEHLEKIHVFVKSIFDSLLGDGKTKREIDEIDMMEEIVEKLIDEEFLEFEIDAEDDADEIIDEIIIEDYEIIEKRELTSVIDKMKGAYKKFGEKFKELLEKVKGINVEELKDMLKKAGSNMLGSVKELYEKIKGMFEKQVAGN